MKVRKENALIIAIDFQEAIMPAMAGRENLERKAEILLKGANVLNVPIVVSQQYTKGLGNTIPSLAEAIGEFDYIDKTSFSCLGNQRFKELLLQKQARDVIVTGIEAHVCVLQTVLDLIEMEYRVFLAADCVSSRSDEDKAYALRRMEQAGAVITTVESILFELVGDATHPDRKAISALVK